jgi:hypothetical protein
MVYQPWRAPWNREDIKPSDIGGSSVWLDEAHGKEYVRTPDILYWYDPTEEKLAIDVPSYEGYDGRRVLRLNPQDFPVGLTRTVPQGTLRLPWPAPGAGLVPGNAATGILARAKTAVVYKARLPQRNDPGSESVPPIDPGGTKVFDSPTIPDRLYIRAVATNSLAPGTDQGCQPEARECIHRQAYSNPLWVTVTPDRFGRLCAPDNPPVVAPGGTGSSPAHPGVTPTAPSRGRVLKSRAVLSR